MVISKVVSKPRESKDTPLVLTCIVPFSKLTFLATQIGCTQN